MELFVLYDNTWNYLIVCKWIGLIVQSAEVVEYTDCFSAEG